MVIENRNLAAGTQLAGTYKGRRYACAVVENEGAIRYSLEDGSLHRSPSAAASRVMGGSAVNGWRFWSLADDLKASPGRVAKATTPAARAEGAPVKMTKVIKRVPNQKGVAEGSMKWWCSACMKAFVVEGTEMPDLCPEGHAREADDGFASTNGGATVE